MNKRNIALILPIIFSLFSCANGTTSSIKEQVLANLLKGVNVNVNGKETITYPSDYSYLSKTYDITLDRDYKTIKESDGSLTPAVRENTNHSFETFIKGDDGFAIREYLTYDNKVFEEVYKIAGNKIIYNERFANPFEYIDVEDIEDDYSLDLVKATYIVESFTSLQYAVKEAKFVVDGSYATSLEVKMFDRIDSIATNETDYIDLVNSLELKILFDYEVNEINHLSPRDVVDSKIENAFSNLETYTINASYEGSQDNLTIYVSSDDVFIHSGYNSALNDGDKYYKYMGENFYDEYTYSSNNGEFELTNFDLNKDLFLPNFSGFSSNILLKNSDDIYSFDTVSSKYGATKLIIPQYGNFDGLGINGTVSLKDNLLDRISFRVYPTTPFNITQKFSNINNTSIPSWLDVSLIK